MNDRFDDIINSTSDNVKVFFNGDLARIASHHIDPESAGDPISVSSENLNQNAITSLKKAAHIAGFNAVIIVSDEVKLAATGSGTPSSREVFERRVLTAVAAKPQPTV